MLTDPWTRSRKDDCLSDLVLDQLRVGELGGEAEREALVHLDTCTRCAQRRDQLAEDAGAMEAQMPPLSIETPSEDSESQPKRRRSLTAVVGTLAAAAAVVLLIRVAVPSQQAGVDPGVTHVEESSGTRTKGGFSVDFVVRREGRVFEGQTGEVVLPGDALRFSYSSVREGHLAILSVDGAQAVSVYYPATSSAEPVRSGSQQDLDSSVVLDDTLGRETVFAVLCERSTPIATLKRALEQARDNPRFPAGCEVDRIELDKRERE